MTFRYRTGDTTKTKRCTVAAEEFIRRFLQHVLPKGFVKVRYYGLFSLGKRPLLAQVRTLLVAQAANSTRPPGDEDRSASVEPPQHPILGVFA